MNNKSRFLTFLSFLMISVLSYATVDLERGMKNIIKLKMPADEVVDSISRFLVLPDNNITDSLQASIAERFLEEQLVPFALKNNCSDMSMAKIYDNLGLLNTHQGPNRIAQAREAFDKAIKYSESANDYFEQGLMLEHKSQAEAKFGDMAKGFILSEEAIRRYKKSGKVAERRIVRCYYTQAVAYLQNMNLEGMKRVIDSISSFSKIVSPDNRVHTLYNLYSVQEAYFGTKAQSAHANEQKAYYDSLNKVSLNSVLLIDANYDEWKNSSIDPTWNYYNRAVLFLEMSDCPNTDSIEYYLNKAKSVDLQRVTHDVEIEISAASVLAEMWMKYGDYAKARDILLDAIKMLDNTEGINNVINDKIEIYKNLVEISRQSGHFEEALEYAGLLSAAEKERYSEETAKDIKELEIKYKTQETELALAQSESRRARILMWLVVVAGLLVIAVAIFLVYAGQQRRRRLQKEMEFANLREDIGRQLTQQYVEGLENERQRMSRELHDGVCNDLLAIQMNITGGAPIEKTASLIDSCRESVRRISHELMPPEFAYASIDEVIRFFIGKQAGANGGKINFSYRSELNGSRNWQDVPDAVALEIYRIVQEAVGNAVKHSGATEIEVSLKLEDTAVTAEIMDNGTYKSSGRKGLGLESIQRRAKAINGTVKISTSEEGGTTVSLIATI